jgi:hypothetical protein
MAVVWAKAWKQICSGDWHGDRNNVRQRQCLRELGVLCMLPDLALEKLACLKPKVLDDKTDETSGFWQTDKTGDNDHPLSGALDFRREKLKAAIQKTIRFDEEFHEIITKVFSTGDEELYEFNPHDFFKATFDVPPIIDLFLKGDNRKNLDLIRQN